jgi:hypothetical protein
MWVDGQTDMAKLGAFLQLSVANAPLEEAELK